MNEIIVATVSINWFYGQTNFQMSYINVRFILTLFSEYAFTHLKKYISWAPIILKQINIHIYVFLNLHAKHI